MKNYWDQMANTTKVYTHEGHTITLETDGKVKDKEGNDYSGHHHDDACHYRWQMNVTGEYPLSLTFLYQCHWTIVEDEATNRFNEHFSVVSNLEKLRQPKKLVRFDHHIELVTDGVVRNSEGTPVDEVANYKDAHFKWKMTVTGKHRFSRTYVYPCSGFGGEHGTSIENEVAGDLRVYLTKEGMKIA